MLKYLILQLLRSSLQSELNSLSSRMEQITHENARLHSELRKSLEAQLQSSARGTANGGSINAAVEGLQQQMDILSKERDSYIELWKQTSKELDTSQKSEQVTTYCWHTLYITMVIVLYQVC